MRTRVASLILILAFLATGALGSPFAARPRPVSYGWSV